MADTFVIVGSLRTCKETEKFKPYEDRESTTGSGWVTRTLNFNVQSGTNSIMVRIKGGNGMTKNGQKIFSRVYNKETKKSENVEIPWTERKSTEWLAKISGSNKFIFDNETPANRKVLTTIKKNLSDGVNLTEEQYKLLGVNSVSEANEKVGKRQIHEYLSAWDYAEVVKKVLDNSDGKTLYKVSGTIDISYSVEKNEFYQTYTVTKIQKMPDDAEQVAIENIDLYFNKNSFDTENWEETVGNDGKTKVSGTGTVNGKLRFYFNDKQRDIKGNFGSDISFEVPGILKNKSLKNRMTAEFAEDVTWKMLPVRLNIINGSEMVELTEDMLTEDQLDDIECGCYTFEELKAKSDKIFGERISKLTFREVKDGKSAEDTVYTDEDMSAPHSAASEALDDDDDDIFD